MHRIDSSTASPNENGTGKAGFTGGTPGVVARTLVGPDWHNAVQEELAAVVESAGLALDKPDRGQVSRIAVNLCIGCQVSGSAVANGSKFTLGGAFGDTSAYTLASNEIAVPTKGLYLVNFAAMIQASPTTNPLPIDITLHAPASVLVEPAATRFSATASDNVLISVSVLALITDLAHHIWVESGVSNSSIVAGSGYLSVIRIHATE